MIARSGVPICSILWSFDSLTGDVWNDGVLGITILAAPLSFKALLLSYFVSLMIFSFGFEGAETTRLGWKFITLSDDTSWIVVEGCYELRGSI